MDTLKLPLLHRCFAIAALDGRAIASKTLISFCYVLTENFKQQNVFSTINEKSTLVPADGTLKPCHRKYFYVGGKLFRHT
jgi:hypothetical protein